MKIWVNSQGQRIGRPQSDYTANISDDALAAEKAKQDIRLVNAPDCPEKYWLPFDGEKFPEMSQEEKVVVDAAEAKEKADAEKAQQDVLAAAETARKKRRDEIIAMPVKDALAALFDLIRPPIIGDTE